MDNKKRNIVILVILCILLVVMGIIIFIDFSSGSTDDNLIINEQSNDAISNDIINDENVNGDIINSESDSNIYADNKTEYTDVEYEDNNDFLDDKNDDSVQNSYDEADVVSYFENMEYEVENSTSFKEGFKEYFIAIVDFIFYDGEIKGYTFDGLTGTAKAKIVAIALKMDAKIDEYVPGYKESISSTTGRVYTNIKEKLVTYYMEISSAVCKDNAEECNRVKDIFSDVKEYCKIGWDFIKGLFKNGITKIKDWYEIYSGK